MTILKPPRKTEKSTALIKAVLKAADEGRFLNWEELVEMIGPKHGITRGCVKNTMDRFCKSEIIAKKTENRRVIYIPTTRAYQIYRGLF